MKTIAEHCLNILKYTHLFDVDLDSPYYRAGFKQGKSKTNKSNYPNLGNAEKGTREAFQVCQGFAIARGVPCQSNWWKIK